MERQHTEYFLRSCTKASCSYKPVIEENKIHSGGGRLLGQKRDKLQRKKCQACSFSLPTIAQASRTAGVVGSAELMGEVAKGKVGEMSIGEKHHQFKTRLSLHTTETSLTSIHGYPKERGEKQSLHSHATEQLKPHSLRSLRAARYLIHHVRTRRKIELENKLSDSAYACQHCLPGMPAEKLIGWSMRILKKPLIEVIASNALAVRPETRDLVIILNNYYLHYGLVMRTSGLIDTLQLLKK